MSWLCPHAEEPTHEEFVVAWQNLGNTTVFHVSVALARLGYVEMHPDVCYRWYKNLRRRGVLLRRIQRAALPRLRNREQRISIQEANALFDKSSRP